MRPFVTPSHIRRGSLSDLPNLVRVVVGLHPKHSAQLGERSSGLLRRIGELLRLPRVVGLGEVGLDHSVPLRE